MLDWRWVSKWLKANFFYFCGVKIGLLDEGKQHILSTIISTVPEVTD